MPVLMSASVPIGGRANGWFPMRSASTARRRSCMAPSRARASLRITPRSASISFGSRVSSLAISRENISAASTCASSPAGRSNLYIVTGAPVPALTSGPKRRPIRSNVAFTSPSGTWVEPWKAMCSRKCARPCWSGPSCIEPARITNRTDTWPGGAVLWRIA